MKVWYEDDPNGIRWYYVDRVYRNGAGEPRHFRRKTNDSTEHIKNQALALAVTGECSLTSLRFNKCVELYLQERGHGGLNDACYQRAIKELGRHYCDKQAFTTAYSQYVAKLEASDLAVNTVNNYKVVIRSICNFAYATGRCGHAAVRDWRIQTGESRNRILSEGEELSLINYLAETRSHILQAVKFSLINPIRKGDLFNLKRKDLQMDVSRWVVRFQAKKTRKRIRVTTLPNIDMALVRYAHSLPKDCPWLFPLLEKRGKETVWRKMEDPRWHFKTVLERCGIHDFHWHDLKHCAETYMLRQGFSYEALRKLGIQTSPKTQAVYDNRRQIDIIEDVLCRNGGQNGSLNVAFRRRRVA